MTGYRWYDHSLVRPFVLARWSFTRRRWHPRRRRLARLRSLYWVLLRRHDTEICGVCGGPVRVVFHVPDAIWTMATGYGGRSPDGESAPGVLCVPCVDWLAHEAGLSYLRWTCDTEDWPMVFQISELLLPDHDDAAIAQASMALAAERWAAEAMNGDPE